MSLQFSNEGYPERILPLGIDDLNRQVLEMMELEAIVSGDEELQELVIVEGFDELERREAARREIDAIFES